MTDVKKIEEAEVVTDEVATPQPKKEEPKVVEVPEPKKEEPKSVEEKPVEKPFTVRSEETGDKVFMVKEGKRYWVKNPETLSEFGFRLGQEKRVLFAELLKWSEGAPLDATAPKGATPPVMAPTTPVPAEATQEEVIKEAEGKPFKVFS